MSDLKNFTSDQLRKELQDRYENETIPLSHKQIDDAMKEACTIHPFSGPGDFWKESFLKYLGFSNESK